MISRITSAYDHFSKLRQKQSHPGSQDAAVHRKNVEQEAPSSPRGGAQEKQVQQLRETGTLENLQAILDESEKALLKKLFPERSHRYSQEGDVITDSGTQLHNKGYSLDKTL